MLRVEFFLYKWLNFLMVNLSIVQTLGLWFHKGYRVGHCTMKCFFNFLSGLVPLKNINGKLRTVAHPWQTWPMIVYFISFWFSTEGVSSTMFFTSNVKNIYFQIWICPIRIAKGFSNPMSKIIQSKQIYGLVTCRPFGP